MSNKDKIRAYILENFLFSDDDSELDNEVSLLEKGVIDSTGIMELVFFLEEQFGVTVDDEEMTPENLDSVNDICAFIDQKQSA